MNHIVSIGGGTSSSLELPVEVVRKYGKENVVLVIAALKNESPDVWRMCDEAERLTGVPVTKINYSPDAPGYTINAPRSTWWGIWDVFYSKKMTVNSRQDPCSRVLKREVLKKYIVANYAPDDTIIHVGVTFEELDRMIAIRRNWKKAGYRVDADLADIERPGTSGERALALVGWQPEAYRLGFKHNNCNKYCGKAGHKHMARLLWYDPDSFYYHAQNERFWQENLQKPFTIMRDTKRIKDPVTGERVHHTYRLTMFDFAIRMKKHWRTLKDNESPFKDLDPTPPCSFCDAAS